MLFRYIVVDRLTGDYSGDVVAEHPRAAVEAHDRGTRGRPRFCVVRARHDQDDLAGFHVFRALGEDVLYDYEDAVDLQFLLSADCEYCATFAFLDFTAD